MLYARAKEVLEEYHAWLSEDENHIRKPKHEDILDAVQTAINVLEICKKGHYVSDADLKLKQIEAIIKM